MFHLGHNLLLQTTIFPSLSPPNKHRSCHPLKVHFPLRSGPLMPQCQDRAPQRQIMTLKSPLLPPLHSLGQPGQMATPLRINTQPRFCSSKTNR